jgi:hypothetical protein
MAMMGAALAAEAIAGFAVAGAITVWLRSYLVRTAPKIESPAGD